MYTNTPHGKAMQAMLPQLLICLVKRAGGSITIPVSEIDATGQDLLSMQVDDSGKNFIFTAGKKS